jgi:hypothetical protein
MSREEPAGDRHNRVMRALLGTVFVLLLLLVGADIGGRLLAQNQAEKALRQHYPAAADPRVSIHGFSFLLQAVQGSYSDITMSSSAVTLGPVTGVRAQIDLHDVSLTLSDAISGDISHLSARRADFRAVFPAASLGNWLDQPNLTIAPGADGFVQLSTTVLLAGRTIPVTVSAAASIAGGSLTLAVKSISAAGVTLPSDTSAKLRKILSATLPLRGLPFSIDHAAVSAQDGALVVTATAVDVTAAQLGLAGSGGSSTTTSTPSATPTR